MKRTFVRLASTAALLLTGLCLYSLAAHAQDATWNPGTTSDWNTATNWTPIPPGTLTPPTGTAEFGTPGVKSLTFSLETSVGTLQVDAPGYSFTDSQPNGVFINGSGVVSTPDNAPTINVNETAGFAFTGMSSAGHATINSGIANGNPNGFDGGFVFFQGSSTAANSKITVFFASNIEFQDTSKAGTATITAPLNGGSIFFENASSADHATITILDHTGELSFSPSFFGGGTATAGNATIISSGTTNFFEGSSAGNATINTHFGTTNFFDTSTAGNAAITVIEGNMSFSNNSRGGTATIIAGRPVSQNGGFDAGFIMFHDTSTADHATISSLDGSSVEFHDSSRADHATLIVGQSGFLEFVDMSSGDQATVINNAGGEVRIADLTTVGTSFGSIEGAGTFNLGSKQLTVGSNNESTTVNGVIEDRFPGEPGDVGGSLVKVGTGTLTLLGDNTYSGGTTIEAGVLEVGTLTSAAQETSTALGTGNVFLDPGTLRTTSSSTGKAMIINVGGNYTQAAGGTLALGVGGLDGSQYDHVQVGGNASLNGTLAVSSLNNFRPVNGNAFEVLHTNGTREGQFAQVSDSLNNNPNLQRVNIYATNGVALLYVAVPGPTPTPPPGPTPTPPPGPAPSPTPNPKPPIDVEIPIPLPPVNPDEPLIPPKFLLSSLDPSVEQLTSMFEIPFSGANTQRFNLTDRMTQIQQGSTGFVSPIAPAPAPIPTGKEIGKKEVVPPAFVPGPTNRWGVWVNGWGDWVNVSDDNGVKGYNFTTGGVSVGVDYRITDYLAIGLFGTYSHTWTSLNPGSIDVNTGLGGLYVTYWNQGFYINGAVFGGYNSYDTSRGELTNTEANGSTSGYEVSTFVDTGYDFHFGNLSFGPVFAAQYTNVHIDGFSEQGSFLPLDIHSDSEESWRTDLGLRASYSWHVGNIIVIPSLWAAWEHEYKYSSLPITISSVEFPGESATVFGPHEGHDSAIINAGVGTQWTPRISTYVGYQGQLGRDNYDANGVTGTISFSF
jgi:outer membrane autotransporter protein